MATYPAVIDFYRIDPVIVASAAALAVSLILAAATSPLLRLPREARGLVTALAPGVLFLTWLMIGGWIRGSRGFDFGRQSTSMVSLTTLVICSVFGFAFAVNCFAYMRPGYRTVAWIFTLLYGTVIAFLFIASLVTMGVVPIVWQNPTHALLGTAGTFLVIWIPIAAILDRRARMALKRLRGCCSDCGYNLTDNLSGVCPECGRQLTWGEQVFCDRFVPSRVEGLDNVREVIVYKDRLELNVEGTMTVFEFSQIATSRMRWQRYLWSTLLLRPIPRVVADVDSSSSPPYFRFYTEPPVTVYLPKGGDQQELLDDVEMTLDIGGFSVFDLTGRAEDVRTRIERRLLEP